MSEPFRPAGIDFRKIFTRILVGIFILGSIFIFYDYQKYNQQKGAPTSDSIQVHIQTPVTGKSLTQGTLLTISALASSSIPFQFAELWVNGVPINIQVAPSGGTTLFPINFAWVPTQDGVYSLTVRAIGEQGLSADSDAVLVTIQPNGNYTVLGQDLEPYVGYQGASLAFVSIPSASANQGQPWQGSPAGWLQSKNENSIPTSPSILALVDACNVQLIISDHAENESGFQVFRQLPNIPGWKLIETLNADNSEMIISYKDSGYHGFLSYKVSAFNSQGHTYSNVVVVEVDPDDCPGSEEIPLLHVELLNLKTSQPADRLYCYANMGEGSWIRWPAEGFLSPMEDGYEIINPSLFALFAAEFAPGEEDSLPPLHLECWGWMGETLEYIGSLKFDGIGGQNFAQIFESTAALSASINLSLETTDDDLDLEELAFKMALLQPHGFASTDVDLCGKFSSEEANFPQDYCTKGEGDTPWPYDPTYLAWLLSYKKYCVAGYNCLDPTNPGLWSDVPGVANGEFGYTIRYNKPGFTQVIETPNQMVLAIPGYFGNKSCDDKRSYLLKSYFIPEGSQKMIESVGEWVEVPSPCREDDFVFVEFSWDELQIVGLEEEEGEGEYFDLYADFRVFTQDAEWQAMYFGGLNLDDCPSPDAPTHQDNTLLFNGECPSRVSDGGISVTQLSDLPISQCDPECSSYQLGNNKMYFSVLDSAAWEFQTGLTGPLFSVRIMDHDLFSKDDFICNFFEFQLSQHEINLLLAGDPIGSTHIQSENCRLNFSVTVLESQVAP